MEAAFTKSVRATDSAGADQRRKTEWDQLTDLCYSSAKKAKLTRKQLDNNLKHVRSLP